ncbi:Methylcrotonoyl-CoA carboxylase subunit alpha, mitochondrial [Cyphellophora attinorum]|uniref:Methylcrotonoyl-CoA carboxylase subunit alpha, mitochondrial n=1 Tax=Cyphellophora attinorum TaxID=1664694 RepID=A0A0N1HCL6_9EURO|nr:Methylcrotonoyl-CoA carboxylase subunit alpha, mitochondrial [Phialophora attinorum]KPI41604.1 Methylcrotonoyl-CoA carboxylase subunit alpha, mitochondrial [Phialophora attinorum]
MHRSAHLRLCGTVLPRTPHCVTIGSLVAPGAAPIPSQRRWNTSASAPAPDTSSLPTLRPIDSILIANRGEIALRVARTAAAHGIKTTTLYTDPDRHAQHAKASPYSFNLGPTSAYLDQDKILRVASEQGCQAIHPGYGFLSENAEFARRCAEQGVKFIGPPASAIESMGDKARSKDIMEQAGVACVPGYRGADQSAETLEKEADKMTYPVLIKAVRGGGGKGMRVVMQPSEFRDKLDSARSEARNSFGNDEVLIEKYIVTPRHVEVQVFADAHGNVVALGERDCSIQRRHQKILEESPAPGLEESKRRELWDMACRAAAAVGYEGAGTVEFIFDADTGAVYFMEMNTRLQVEHPVTEMVTGVDLVEWQVRVARGEKLPLTQEEIVQRMPSLGHAIEARIYAENPDKGFVPDSGWLEHVRLPEQSSDVRIDTGFTEGDEVSTNYDPMIAKLIVRGETRKDALRKMALALEEYEIAGPVTNIDFVKRVVKSPDFIAGEVETGYIEKHRNELFPELNIPDEALAEAALASYFHKFTSRNTTTASFTTTAPSWLRSDSDFQPRTFTFQHPDAESLPGQPPPETFSVSVQRLSPTTFAIDTASQSWTVTSTYDPATKTLTTYFPHTRHTTRVSFPARSPNSPIHLFTPLGSHRLQPAPPAWLTKALGKTENPNSLLSPMPAKILRVAVKPGQTVGKDEILLVIESMKMETVVRSPGEGLVVKRVRVAEGESVAGGVELVEFEDVGEEDGKA